MHFEVHVIPELVTQVTSLFFACFHLSSSNIKNYLRIVPLMFDVRKSLLQPLAQISRMLYGVARLSESPGPINTTALILQKQQYLITMLANMEAAQANYKKKSEKLADIQQAIIEFSHTKPAIDPGKNYVGSGFDRPAGPNNILHHFRLLEDTSESCIKTLHFTATCRITIHIYILYYPLTEG